MGRSRTGWALSVAAPWCLAFAVLLSITAEAEQEPLDGGAFDRNGTVATDAALLSQEPPRAVDEDGAPLPIVQARYVADDPSALAAMSDEIEPNGALKAPPHPFPDVDRAAMAIRSWAFVQALAPSGSRKRRPGPTSTRFSPGRTNCRTRATPNSTPARP